MGNLAAYHKNNPNQSIISSESCSCITDRNEYVDSSETGHCSAYGGCPWNNIPCPDGCWVPISENDYIIGSFDWTGFDYKGEPTPYNWPDVNSHFGVSDIAGFPKDDYWYYRAWWQQGNETIIHILPDDWNQWSPNQKVEVWIYTNVDYIDLQLNGKSVSNGMQPIQTQSPLQLTVEYQVGMLTAIGYNMNKNEIGNHSVETTGKPYAIQLIAEYPGNTIYSDGQDVSLIEAKIVDNMGRRVPNADNMITFSIEGDGMIYGVGNGDPASHEPDKGSSRSAFHGRARVIVQSIRDKPGSIKLTASSDGLISKSCVV